MREHVWALLTPALLVDLFRDSARPEATGTPAPVLSVGLLQTLASLAQRWFI